MIENENTRIWNGVYDAFPETIHGNPWDSQNWLTKLAMELDEFLNNTEVSDAPSRLNLVHEYPLAPIVSTLLTSIQKPVHILDFGGGLGVSFFSLVKMVPRWSNLEYSIVEGAEICEYARKNLGRFNNLHFFDELPPDLRRFDIVHAGSSLHYVRDWKGMLARFTEYGPRFIILSGLTAGNIQTFVTFQNYYEFEIPVWFWNKGEIISTLSAMDYELLYSSFLASEYCGKIQSLPMMNLPPECRIERKCNLVFGPLH